MIPSLPARSRVPDTGAGLDCPGGQRIGAASSSRRRCHLLDRLLADATAKARWASVLEILIVRALALWAQGARSDALATIGRALALAAPEGYIRRFVDEGPVLTAMLEAAACRGVAPDYVTRLLAAFRRTRRTPGSRPQLAPRPLDPPPRPGPPSRNP